MKVIVALLPAAFAVQISQPHAIDTQHMKETFRSIAAQKAKKGEVPAETLSAVDEMLNTIRSTLEPAIAEDQAGAQSLYDGAVAGVNACTTQHDEAFAGPVAGAEAATNAARGAHSGCKADELAAHIDMTTKCDNQDARVAGFNHCPQEVGWSADSDVVNAWIDCTMAFVEGQYDGYKVGRAECIAATNFHREEVGRSHGLQGQFEADYCAWQSGIDLTCEGYDGCRAGAIGIYNSDRTTVEGMENVFKTQQEAMELLLCYGQSIMDEVTDLSHCDGAGCEGCDALSISYGDYDAEIACLDAKAPSAPCDEAWTSAEYQFDVRTPVTACNACPGEALN